MYKLSKSRWPGWQSRVPTDPAGRPNINPPLAGPSTLLRPYPCTKVACRRLTTGIRNNATHTHLPISPSIKHVPPLTVKKTAHNDYSNRDVKEGMGTGLPDVGGKGVAVVPRDLSKNGNANVEGRYAKTDSQGDFLRPGTLNKKDVTSATESDSLKHNYRVQSTSTYSSIRNVREPGVEDAFDAIPEAILSSRWKNYDMAQNAGQNDFEAFRRRHSEQAYLTEYHPPYDLELSVPPQPHDYHLTSRYDWRLRAPSRSLQQKQAYGGKNIWRKQSSEAASPEFIPGLTEYQKKLLRFIELERREAEDSALARLKRVSKYSEGSSLDGSDNLPAGQEYLIGLKAVVEQPSTSKNKRKTRDMSVEGEPRQLHSNTLEALTSSLGMSETGSEISQIAEWTEDVSDAEADTSAGVTVSFTSEHNEDLPDNAFKPGKMVFIWRCRRGYGQDGGFYVPELRDSTKTWEELRPIPFRGYVKRSYKNRIDIQCPTTFPRTNAKSIFRMDLGYDDTSFARMLDAVQNRLPCDATAQRATNDVLSKGPHIRQRDIEICGTELQDFLLQQYTPKVATNANLEVKAETGSSLLMQDQRIASWARRYSRRSPLHIEGDPDLGLNNSQLYAVACAIQNRLMLIQGPPGTGKTATIVAALRLLKEHFSIPFPILVCAQTNVAVDIIGLKCLQAGLNPLRFGILSKINPHLRQHSFDERLKAHNLQERLRYWAGEEERTQAEINDISLILNPTQIGESIYAKDSATILKEVRQKKATTKARMAKLILQLKQIKMNIVKAFKEIQTDLIESSDVCLTTCIGATNWTMRTADFPIVFLDEAGQCDEPTSLIPLMKGSRQLVMIGDHKQLPSVVSSNTARMEGLNISLFERLMRQEGTQSVLLDTQYRMLPTISAFPNKQFYNHSIRDHFERRQTESRLLAKPVTFIHHENPEVRVNLSTMNDGEANIIMQLIAQLSAEGHSDLSKIGVISTYAAQSNLLQKKAKQLLGDNAYKLEIATVDGFQGREMDIVILSTVRSNSNGSIGFLSDARRLNVAITRARERLFVVGNAHTLSRINVWHKETHVFANYVDWLRKNDLVRTWPKELSQPEMAIPREL